MAENKIAELDFVKGIAILSVILLHTVSYQFLFDSYAFFHIWQAVPLFILISYILIFSKLDKRGDIRTYYSKRSIFKVVKRIALPFILFQCFIFIFDFIRTGNGNIYGLIYGNGPGAYYPFVYIQLWLTAPSLFCLLNKFKYGGGILLTLCLALNIIISVFLDNDTIYSRLLVRYLYIAFLAYLWIKGLYKRILILSVISITYYFITTNYKIDFTPFFDKRWYLQQLPAYFYTLLFFALCYKLYSFVKIPFNWLIIFIEWCGRNSYEIYLLQMFVLNYLSYEYLITNGIKWHSRIIYIFIITLMSILPVYIYRKLKNDYQVAK